MQNSLWNGLFISQFPCYPFYTPDFEESLLSALGEPDNRHYSLRLNSITGTYRLSTLQAHTDTAVLPVCIVDVKYADKSTFLLM